MCVHEDTIMHECPRCGDHYKRFRDVLVCMEHHEIHTDEELGKVFAEALHELLIGAILRDGTAVKWTRTWAETMPKDRAKYVRN